MRLIQLLGSLSSTLKLFKDLLNPNVDNSAHSITQTHILLDNPLFSCLTNRQKYIFHKEKGRRLTTEMPPLSAARAALSASFALSKRKKKNSMIRYCLHQDSVTNLRTRTDYEDSLPFKNTLQSPHKGGYTEFTVQKRSQGQSDSRSRSLCHPGTASRYCLRQS